MQERKPEDKLTDKLRAHLIEIISGTLGMITYFFFLCALFSFIVQIEYGSLESELAVVLRIILRTSIIYPLFASIPLLWVATTLNGIDRVLYRDVLKRYFSWWLLGLLLCINLTYYLITLIGG